MAKCTRRDAPSDGRALGSGAAARATTGTFAATTRLAAEYDERAVRPLLAFPLLLTLALGCGGDGGSGDGAASPGGAAGTGGAAGNGGGGAGGGTKPDPCALHTAAAGLDPDAALPELTLATPVGPTTLRALRRGCDAPGVLLVRVEPASCAPCGRLANALPETLSPFPSASVDVVTVLYADEGGAPPTAGTAADWATSHPLLPGTKAASAEAGAWVAPSGVVPLVLVVDRRTLRVSSLLDVPPSQALVRARVRDGLKEAGAGDFALPDEPPPVDGRWTAHEWGEIQAMAAPLVPPPDPTNAHADDPAAAMLGTKLFGDPKLGTALVSCGTCHDPSKAFADGLPTGKGVSVVKLNTPSVTTSAWARFQFWDGRADSLWAQALGPIESAAEMGSSRLQVAHRIHEAYAADYENVFGKLPDLADTKRFPPKGKPGDPAWEAMAPADRDDVDRVFVHAGKAIAAMERTLRPPMTRLEAYAAGDAGALTEDEKHGLSLFFSAGCISCHHGPTIEDGAFHDILMPASDAAGPADAGRRDGVTALLASPFRGDGPFSDDPVAGAKKLAGLASSEALYGQEKTPSLRGVTATGPWGHGGTFKTLEAVMVHYGRPKPDELVGPAYAGKRDPALPRFTAEHDQHLVAILRVFSGE